MYDHSRSPRRRAEGGVWLAILTGLNRTRCRVKATVYVVAHLTNLSISIRYQTIANSQRLGHVRIGRTGIRDPRNGIQYLQATQGASWLHCRTWLYFKVTICSNAGMFEIQCVLAVLQLPLTKGL